MTGPRKLAAGPADFGRTILRDEADADPHLVGDKVSNMLLASRVVLVSMDTDGDYLIECWHHEPPKPGFEEE